MRDQYAGDVSDVLKFAFLRALAGHDRTLGVAWYYVPDNDGGPDGRHIEWREEPAWQRLDPVLHAGLTELPDRKVAALEHSDIWPEGTLFHQEPVPAGRPRIAWGERQRVAMNGADIVFLDPDIGLGVESEKYATISELRLLRQPGRAVVFITFPARKRHPEMVQHLHEQLRAEVDAETVFTLRTSVCVPYAEGSRLCIPRPRWFTVVDPDVSLIARSRVFAEALASVPRVKVWLDGAT